MNLEKDRAALMHATSGSGMHAIEVRLPRTVWCLLKKPYRDSGSLCQTKRFFSGTRALFLISMLLSCCNSLHDTSYWCCCCQCWLLAHTVS